MLEVEVCSSVPIEAELQRWCTTKSVTVPDLRLKTLAEWLVPSCEKLVANAHTAGADAQLLRLLYFEILKLFSGSQAAMGGGA